MTSNINMISQRRANEDGRRACLALFGYKQHSATARPTSYEVEWTILKTDFNSLNGHAVLEFEALPPFLKPLATAYIDKRRELDGLMDICDHQHLAILSGGAAATLVEDYSRARDNYEDEVEEFGALRVEMSKQLERVNRFL